MEVVLHRVDLGFEVTAGKLDRDKGMGLARVRLALRSVLGLQ